MLAIAVPVLAAVPAWVWAIFVMAGFVALSAFTMWLTRFPVRRVPPPLVPRDGDSKNGKPPASS